jgi:hypothetical protein
MVHKEDGRQSPSQLHMHCREPDMGHEIVIRSGDIELQAELDETPTAEAVLDALPIGAQAQRWGEEIYFSIGLTCELESDSRDVLQAGELGYWPPGTAFCIFWGPTPASQGDEIRAASAVNVIGRITGDLSSLGDVQDGRQIRIEKV